MGYNVFLVTKTKHLTDSEERLVIAPFVQILE